MKATETENLTADKTSETVNTSAAGNTSAANAKGSLKKRLTIYQMALIGVMTALTCVLAPLSIPLPFSPVPISLTSLVIYLSALLLGAYRGSISYIVYLLLGIVGLPVFSGFTGGFMKLAGPTGGYLIGFVFLAFICGFAADHFPENRWIYLASMVLGTLVLYAFGTIWLALQMNSSFFSALLLGVIPFLPGDAVKIILITIIGPIIKKRIPVNR